MVQIGSRISLNDAPLKLGLSEFSTLHVAEEAHANQCVSHT